MPQGTGSGGYEIVTATLLELTAEAERSPRGHVQYLVRPAEDRR